VAPAGMAVAGLACYHAFSVCFGEPVICGKLKLLRAAIGNAGI